MNLLGLAVPLHIVGPTGFDTTDHHHQTLLDAVSLRDLLGQLPFVHQTGVEVLVGPTRRGRRRQSRLLNLLGQPSGKVTKVFDPYATGVQISLHDLRTEKMSQRPTKTQTVKALQATLDQRLEFGNKGRRDTRLGRRDEV